MRDAGPLERRTVPETLVGRDVGHRHVEDVLDLPRGARARHDLRAGGHRALEALHAIFGVLVEVGLHHHAQAQAHLGPVHQRRVAADHAGGLPGLDPLAAGCGRRAGMRGELLHVSAPPVGRCPVGANKRCALLTGHSPMSLAWRSRQDCFCGGRPADPPHCRRPPPSRHRSKRSWAHAPSDPSQGLDAGRFVLACDSAGVQIAAQVGNLTVVPSHAQTLGIAPALQPGQLQALLLFFGPCVMRSSDATGAARWFMHTVLRAYSGTRHHETAPAFAATANVISPDGRLSSCVRFGGPCRSAAAALAGTGQPAAGLGHASAHLVLPPGPPAAADARVPLRPGPPRSSGCLE